MVEQRVISLVFEHDFYQMQLQHQQQQPVESCYYC